MLSVCNECPYPRDNNQYLDGILQLGRKTLHRPQPESRPDNPEKRKATRCHRRSQNRPEGANLIEIPCDLHISERPEWGSLFLCRTPKITGQRPERRSNEKRYGRRARNQVPEGRWFRASHGSEILRGMEFLGEMGPQPNRPGHTGGRNRAMPRGSERTSRWSHNARGGSLKLHHGENPYSSERLAHPRRGWKLEFKQERCPPLDVASCSLLIWIHGCFGVDCSNRVLK